ncbi:hypothetical protein [Homoserinimonas hongtaonis]|uniref:Restriction endonuclease type IV Mrr domain-containing protein n=1 Tax=Homoserinimonas hongtaonis TaxID=2079791 RepID=A0A2U1T2X5_9MICO|nr:hypothetical protein [Salinibacterium hongtaonis]PWB98235.1 hypothetical protein DF220_10660 [Salinibacterium hongtaonis]
MDQRDGLPAKLIDLAPHRVAEVSTAEGAMLHALSRRFSLDIRPRTIELADGTRTEVEGADASGSIIVQLVANTGVFKSPHRNKVHSDMFKLVWLRSCVLVGARAVLCVSPTASQAFSRGGWSTAAASALGIEVLVCAADGTLAALFDETEQPPNLPERNATPSVAETARP